MSKIKKLFVIIISAVFVSLSAAQAFAADTIYILDGYSYNRITSDTIALCGWDTEISTDLVIPDSLNNRYFVSVVNFGFQNNTELTSLDMSQARHLSSIGVMAFKGCTGISNDIVIPASSVGLAAFQDCSSLTGVTFTGDLTNIYSQTFYKCASLAKVELPETLETIEQFAFGNCPLLTDIYIPDSATDIDDYAFYNSPNVVINCHEGTYAQEYAERNGIPYVLVDIPVDYSKGDVNRDGRVDITDATLIQRFLAEMDEFDGEQLNLADVNQDDEVNISDATEIQIIINLA